MTKLGLLALALTTAPVQDATDFERFELFNNCEPMYLLVEIHHRFRVGYWVDRGTLAVRGGKPLEGRTVV